MTSEQDVRKVLGAKAPMVGDWAKLYRAVINMSDARWEKLETKTQLWINNAVRVASSADRNVISEALLGGVILRDSNDDASLEADQFFCANMKVAADLYV
jgi:hypothetical protein